jgi:Amt family ammonium transporter
LAKRGVIDFAGGYVIHLSAGVAGFTAAYWVCIFIFIFAF